MTRVAILGGAGYLGRGLLRSVARGERPWEITAISRDESKHIRVRSRYSDVRIVRADVAEDVNRLTDIFAGHDIVIHAAANKLVDIGELNAWEVVRNNVIGSMNVAQAAMRAGVKRVVGISTDKCVQPVSVYGTTKLIMERLFQEADQLTDTEFTCARYGNVVGSTISVILYFQDQLKTQGYLQITNPEMTRFYMGVDEAIAAIDAALAAERGSVVIPKMQGMRLTDTARVALGLQPEEELPKDKVRIVGERPGEKVHESLLHRQESVRVKQIAGIEGYYDDDTKYFELRPVTERHRDAPFQITSESPPLGWMPFERMLQLIEDAKDV
jgi:UDP-N-acetylglucosamine 4,6-dehydratase/5-epimerase